MEIPPAGRQSYRRYSRGLIDVRQFPEDMYDMGGQALVGLFAVPAAP